MFSAFTPLNGGQLSTYDYPTEYPYDLDGSLDFTRPATGFSPFPYPLSVGHIEGLMPLMNPLEYSLMLGKTPYGPWTGVLPTDPAIVFPQIFGSMKKVTG